MKTPPRIYKADPTPPTDIVKKYAYVKEVRFTVTKKGQRKAFYYGTAMRRWFPLPVDVADYLLAGGYAEIAG